MRLAIYLASRNVEEGTGGPFGAAVFETDSGKLISAGVNVVLSNNCSLAHAEAMALMLAQKSLGTHDFAASHIPPLELVSSAQPCIQCFGNLWWSGIKRLVIGASSSEVERITGFKEGPVPPDWKARLEQRVPCPVVVISGLMEEESCRILEDYVKRGGVVYNPGEYTYST